MPRRAVISKSLVLGCAAAVLFASAASRMRHGTDMRFERNSQTADMATRTAIERFNQALNRHEVQTLESLLTDDTVFEDTSPAPDARRVEVKAAVLTFWRQWFVRNPDATIQSRGTIVSGDRAFVRWVYRKVRNGKPWHLRGVDVFTVRDGKVAAKLAFVKG